MVGYSTLICKPLFNKTNNSWRFYISEYISYTFLGKHFKNCNFLLKKEKKQYSVLRFYSIKAYLWFHIIFKTIWLIESIFLTSLFRFRKRMLKFLILRYISQIYSIWQLLVLTLHYHIWTWYYQNVLDSFLAIWMYTVISIITHSLFS